MYNLLVTQQKDDWNLPAYEYDRSRFGGEYNSHTLREKFKELSEEAIES